VVSGGTSYLSRLRAVSPWHAVSLAVLVAMVWAGKRFYSHASAAELRWILAPTARLVSWVSGGAFVYESGAGWVSREFAFIIAPACAGLNFALAAWVVLMLGGLNKIRSGGSMLRRIAATAVVAYVATLLVNTTRIAIAIALHRGVLEVGAASPADVHRAEGILIYLTGLCALYALAQAESRRLNKGATDVIAK
jgi:exosortase K